MKIQTLERTRNMEVYELLMQDFANKSTRPKLQDLVNQEEELCRLVMIFGIDEESIPLKEERVKKAEWFPGPP